ncbi:flagellar hook-length control protein FliK [Colwelliaceae bacterium 6441]
MPQINVLAIDIAQATESKGISEQPTQSDASKSSAFSDVMAKHENQESGNNSQNSGKEGIQGAGTKVDENSNTGPNTHQGKVKRESTDETDPQRQVRVDSGIDNSDVENQMAKVKDGELYYSLETESFKKFESETEQSIAQKLLSFITASDEVSTKHVDLKTIPTDGKLANGEQVNEFSKESLAKGNKGLIEGSDDSKAQDKAIKITTLNTNSQAMEAGSKAEETSPQNNVKQEGKVQGSAENFEGEKLAKEAKPSATVSSASDAIVESQNESADTESEKARINAKGAESLSTSPLTSNSTTEMDDIPEEKLEKSINVSDKTLDKITLESAKKEQSIQGKVTAEDDTHLRQPTNVAEIKLAEVKAQELKGDEKSSLKVDNAGSQSITFNQPSSSQSGSHSQGQSEQSEQKYIQGLNKNNTEQVKDEQLQFVKNEVKSDIDEKMTTTVGEKQLLKASIDESSAYRTLSQQSLNHAEEQAMQSSIAKASADSMSVQSTKTAINIHNETIAIHRKDFSDAVKDKVMVMINQKIRQLEIRLDPPELGSMHVKLNLQNEQAAVNFVVQNQQAKEALEQNMGRLKDMLAQSGVDVGEANIEQRNQQSADSDEFAQQGENNRSSNNDTLEQEITMSAANLYKASTSNVDYYA